jgi:DNA repair exonuclease SbcCD nuclease subunit
MKTKVIFIGDPHFQINNITEIERFIPAIKSLALDTNPDIIVIAGDLLHTHERLHTTVLNKAYDLVKSLKTVCPVYILVGNHDYISNTQFLTTSHWMNGMKEWENVTIVDKVMNVHINTETFTMVPYVYPGRFMEALSTLNDESWMNSECIFAHQEFEGCKMGAIVSVEGDKWPLHYPLVVSGHIHSKQRPQKNIYYTGTPMQIAFGESEDNIVAVFGFEKGMELELNEVKLDLPGKKIIYMDVSDISEFVVNTDSDDKLRITLSGDYDQFKAVKKTVKYKELIESGVKIVFNVTKDEQHTNDHDSMADISTTDFSKILLSMIVERKDVNLLNAYDHVVNQKTNKKDDVFFL